jgi:hypothetical protein
MKNSAVGYIGSALILLAGILMLVGGSTLSGVVLLCAGIAGIAARWIIGKRMSGK